MTCKKYTADDFEKDFYYYSSREWKNETTIEFQKFVTKPLKQIGNYVFYYCTNLVSINIPNGITRIGESSFENCSNLTSITFPSSLKEIEPGAFRGCVKLESLTLPDSVSILGNCCFSGCSKLSSITLPSSLKIAGIYSFSECRELQSVKKVPKFLEWFGAFAFENCVKLSEIEIPYATNLGEGAFFNCSSLTSMTIPTVLTKIHQLTFYSVGLKNIIIPENVLSIEDEAFADCTDLIDVILPTTLVKIDEDAFRNSNKVKIRSIFENLSESCSKCFSKSCLIKLSESEYYKTYLDFYFKAIQSYDTGFKKFNFEQNLSKKCKLIKEILKHVSETNRLIEEVEGE